MENQEVEVKLGTIGALAPQVGEASTALSAAIVVERDAEAAVLTRAIELAKPALRAVCNRVTSVNGSTSGQNGCNPAERVEYLPGRYLILIDYETVERDTSGNEGWYAGNLLLLDNNGALHETESSGSWSHWQGAWSTRERSIRPLTPREAIDEYPTNGLRLSLESLEKALQQQAAGRAPERTKAAIARAEKLRAVAQLAK